MSGFWKHFNTVNKHRLLVFGYCLRAGIPFQGLTHDLSKYSFEEFLPSAKHYQGNRSPNEGERDDYGYSKAWMHHKGRNKHHFEYWNDVDPVTRVYAPVPMPIKYLVESICDRMAASKTYKGADYTDSSAYEYFMSGKGRIMMHPDSSEYIGSRLKLLAEKGEKALFDQLKKDLVSDKRK